MTQKQQPQNYGQIFRFWFPLATTWLMMAAEGPFLAAIIARLGAEKANLAAYGVAYAFALVAESPVIMLMSASTALCKSRGSYLRLRNFSFLLSLIVTIVFGLFLLPPIFDLVVTRLLSLPDQVARLIHTALLCLLAWPGAIGIRRFYQGVLIAAHKTRRVAIGTMLRLVSMSSCALICYFFSSLEGAVIGALALSVGVCCEAMLTRVLAHQAVKEILAKPATTESHLLNYKEIWNYYLPLMLTPFIGLSIHPMVTFFLGKGLWAVESLAVMPVIYGLTFVFRALGLSFQEVAIALLNENTGNYVKVRNFATGLACFTSGCLALIAFTPLCDLWFQQISGLSQLLADFATLPLQITAIFPALTVFFCFQRSVLIVAKQTRPVSLATAVEGISIFILLFLALLYLPVAGAIAATSAYVCGRLCAIASLHKTFTSFTGHYPREKQLP